MHVTVRNFEIFFIHSEDEFYQNELNLKVKNLKKITIVKTLKSVCICAFEGIERKAGISVSIWVDHGGAENMLT